MYRWESDTKLDKLQHVAMFVSIWIIAFSISLRILAFVIESWVYPLLIQILIPTTNCGLFT